jgi:hypothetical protein
MKNILIVCFIFCIALPLIADEDIFSGLNIKDNINVILKNGNGVKGMVRYITKDKVVVDISYADPDLKGTITVYKKDIRMIDSLLALTDIERKKMMQEKESRLKKYREEIKSIPKIEQENSPESKREKPVITEESSEEEKLAILLVKFPPEKGWDEKKKNYILEKMEVSRTDEEKEFIKVFDEWRKAIEVKSKTERQSILEMFPPEKGWSKEKYQEISTRWARIKVGRTEEEQDFVSKFSQWEKALEEKKKQEEEQKKENVETEKQPQPPAKLENE